MEQQPVPLTKEQAEAIAALAEAFPGVNLREVVKQAMDSHQGPFQYSGRPDYLVEYGNVPLSLWEGLADLKRMHLSSGPTRYAHASKDEIEAQTVDPLAFEEIIEALKAVLEKLLGLDDKGDTQPANMKPSVQNHRGVDALERG